MSDKPTTAELIIHLRRFKNSPMVVLAADRLEAAEKETERLRKFVHPSRRFPPPDRGYACPECFDSGCAKCGKTERPFTPDWDLLEVTQESLREHMIFIIEIGELLPAGVGFDEHCKCSYCKIQAKLKEHGYG